ncbi:MAG: hypothetical protein M3521_09555 [Acidobacteriota bacterium]|jgi:hypothetical protein|nr:hypothetical protein [Acidobacteriota bacterium]
MSKTNFISVPFKTESGLSQIDGIGKFSSAGIVLEFESKLFGIIKNGVKEIRLSTADILDVRFRKGLFKIGAKIEIRLKSFAKLSELPNKNGKLALKIRRDDFQRAQEAVAKLEKDLTEYQESLPPTHTPVSRLFEDEETITRENISKNKI